MTCHYDPPLASQFEPIDLPDDARAWLGEKYHEMMKYLRTERPDALIGVERLWKTEFAVYGKFPSSDRIDRMGLNEKRKKKGSKKSKK